MKQNNKLVILVDSDAFVALAKEDDSNHAKAISILNSLNNKPVTFITSNYVFAESVTVISMRLGHDAAITFIDNIKSNRSIFTVEKITDKIEDLAIDLFKKQTSKNVSFTDCTNMALMRELNLNAIFSFDEVYKKNNLRTTDNL